MTWLLGLIPPQYKILSEALLALMLIVAGWFLHTVWDGYREKNQAVVEVKIARQGEANIIKSNTDYSQELSHVQADPCVNTAVPAGLLKLLNQ